MTRLESSLKRGPDRAVSSSTFFSRGKPVQTFIFLIICQSTNKKHFHCHHHRNTEYFKVTKKQKKKTKEEQTNEKEDEEYLVVVSIRRPITTRQDNTRRRVMMSNLTAAVCFNFISFKLYLSRWSMFLSVRVVSRSYCCCC